MKKIPTLFERKFDGHRIVKVLPIVVSDMEWVLAGEGIATIKWDGSCCAIIDGEFYKRYDAKWGRNIPEGAVQCEKEPDPITGHLPCWIKCDRDNPSDKWFFAAYDNNKNLVDGTYEAVGLHFQGNPYNYEADKLIKHGTDIVTVERTFDGIEKFLEENYIEGIVFWKDGQPRGKIKRRDFGMKWK